MVLKIYFGKIKKNDINPLNYFNILKGNEKKSSFYEFIIIIKMENMMKMKQLKTLSK